jgi:hypothetical protein
MSKEVSPTDRGTQSVKVRRSMKDAVLMFVLEAEGTVTAITVNL